jgi:hypothetical protein
VFSGADFDALHHEFNEVRSRALQLVGRRSAVEQRRQELTQQIAQLTADQQILLLTGQAFDQLLQLMAHDSLSAVEQLVTYGLRTTFPDLDLTFTLKVETKRNLQTLEPRLRQGRVEAPILGAFGGGPARVVAFLLRLLVARKLSLAPVLLLDESFSFVAEQYLDNLGKLLREMADLLGITLVLVTHQPTLTLHASRVYEISSRPDGAAVFTPR